MKKTESLRRSKTFTIGLVIVLMFASYMIGSNERNVGSSNAKAAQIEEPPLDVYYPNTETLGSDEMRVIALGTGTPNFRRSQASASWLVELGNGEKFIFDIGTGSLSNLGALEIPYTYLDKIFVSHFHVDHIGDLDAIFIGGWVSNRTVPLRVWGPGGLKPELGTKYAVDRMREMFSWDLTGRKGNMPSGGGHVEVTEFDYSKIHVV